MSITNSILNLKDTLSTKPRNIKEGLDKAMSVMNEVGGLSKAAGSYTDRIQSLLGINKGSPSKIRTLYTNGFFAQDGFFIPNFFVRAFDEPTYLTFRIEFIWDDTNDPKPRNIAYNNYQLNPKTSAMTAVHYNEMFDYMPEPFLFGSGEYRGYVAKDSSYGKQYSTEYYLDYNLGDHGRAAMLHNFKAALKDIEENFPFYFKSISGLSTLSAVNPTYGARIKDGAITIECEEGLDLKITQLLNMYRKIVWDDTYQRWVLPDMMRFFGMRIYISEIRLFHHMEKKSSWGKLNLDILGNNGQSSAYDLKNSDVRNATNLPLDKSKWWEVANKALTEGTAISNAFLGTKSYITQALNYASGMVTSAMSTLSGLDETFNDAMLCNNAINEVMPTICLECHMCEFDISETLKHVDNLSSNAKDSKSVSPSIKIKVGQVKETQAYPLNKFLSNKNGKYLIDSRYLVHEGLSENPSLLNAERDGNSGWAGQFVSDNVLNKRYIKSKLSERLDEYHSKLSGELLYLGKPLISKNRLSKDLENAMERGELDYSTDGSSRNAAALSLTASLLNEANDLVSYYNDEGKIINTKSLAQNQDSQLIYDMNVIKDKINETLTGEINRRDNLRRNLRMMAKNRSLIHIEDSSKSDKIKWEGISPPVIIREGEVKEEDPDNARYYSINEISKHELNEINKQAMKSIPEMEKINITDEKINNDINPISIGGDYDGQDAETIRQSMSEINENSSYEKPQINSGRIYESDDTERNRSINKLEMTNEYEKSDTMRAIGEMLMRAADEIYNGSEIKSLATSDINRALIANKLFNDYVNELDKSAEENSSLKRVIDAFKIIQENGSKSTATTNGKIESFSFINN